MLVVKIELHSVITGQVKEIGRAFIWNTGYGTHDRGEYSGYVCRKGSFDWPKLDQEKKQGEREITVTDYPRLSYNVWRLIIRALKSAFPEEK